MSRNLDLWPDHLEAIGRVTRDYFEGWFEGDPERLARVTILDTTPNLASVRVEGGPYLDLLHVGRFGDTWRIVNVLWEPRGGPQNSV